jgi:hypothetical protein
VRTAVPLAGSLCEALMALLEEKKAFFSPGAWHSPVWYNASGFSPCLCFIHKLWQMVQALIHTGTRTIWLYQSIHSQLQCLWGTSFVFFCQNLEVKIAYPQLQKFKGLCHA